MIRILLLCALLGTVSSCQEDKSKCLKNLAGNKCCSPSAVGLHCSSGYRAQNTGWANCAYNGWGGAATGGTYKCCKPLVDASTKAKAARAYAKPGTPKQKAKRAAAQIAWGAIAGGAGGGGAVFLGIVYMLCKHKDKLKATEGGGTPTEAQPAADAAPGTQVV